MSDKRPAKNLTVNFINTQYACYDSKVPGVTKETVAAQIEYGNYYLYEGEANAEAIKLAEKDPKFSPEEYIDFLVEVGAVREGVAPAFGGGGTTIDSIEKAKEFAANPDNEAEIAEIMVHTKALTEHRKALNSLLDKGVTFGMGFNSGARNKARLKAQEAAGGAPEKVEEAAE